MESDSKLLVNWILNNSELPWSIVDIILKIKSMLEVMDNWILSPCYREGNRVADYLANWGLNCSKLTWISNFQSLSQEVKGELYVDIMQLPSFRTKLIRNFFCG